MATTVGIQLFDASGTLTFDSRSAVGGVTGDYREYAAGAAGETVNYTQWAGFSALLIRYDATITLDTTGSYPVVTVASSSSARSFALLVF